MKQLSKLLSALSIIMMFGTAVWGQSDSITVVANGSDTIVSGINATGTKTVCNGDSLVLNVTYSGSIDHVVWMANPGGTTPFTPNNTSFTVTVNPTTTTDYYVYVYDGPSSYVGYIRVAVFIAPLPLTQTVTANGIVSEIGNYCQGSAGTVFGLLGSQVACNYQLRDDATLANIGAPVAGTGTAITFPAQPAGNYQILVTSAAGCFIIIK